jgi:hypothetical protein
MTSEATLIAFALPLAATVTQVAHSTYKRLRNYAVARCVWRISNLIMAEEEPSDEEIRALRLRFPCDIMVDSVIFIAEKIYGYTLYRLALIVEVCEIEYVLIYRIRHSRGADKARLLSKLSAMSYTVIAEEAEAYIEEEDRNTRFCAMATLVSARPDRAIHYIAKFDAPITLLEAALLTQLMRRNGAPIAYTPLLISQNRNLQMLGIYLSGHFSIADAEPHLQRLVEEKDKEVAYLALQTLCSIRGNISTSQVRNCLQQMASHQRFSFLLHAVQNCYSLRSCAPLLTSEERTLFAQQINSYKCRIVCN